MAPNTITGNCKLCLQKKILKKSHALPNAAFKKLFKENNGRALRLNSKEEPITTTSESGKEYLLCNECESHINDNFEKTSLGILNGRLKKDTKSDHGITFKEISTSNLRMFYLSIIWRMSISGNEIFKNIEISKEDEESLRNDIYKVRNTSNDRFTVTLYKVSGKEYGLLEESPHELMMLPFNRSNIYGSSKYQSICFIYMGFFCEVFLGRRKDISRNIQTIKIGKSIQMAPYISMLDIPELMHILASSFDQYEKGNTDRNAKKMIEK